MLRYVSKKSGLAQLRVETFLLSNIAKYKVLLISKRRKKALETSLGDIFGGLKNYKITKFSDYTIISIAAFSENKIVFKKVLCNPDKIFLQMLLLNYFLT